MGGRGASSGRYKWRGKWHTYGDEYKTVYQYRNIKFIKIREGAPNVPMETMTQGRMYVVIRPDDGVKSIAYYTGSGKRRKQIDFDHFHKIDGIKMKPHVHLGEVHGENGNRAPTAKERKMIDKARKLWQDHLDSR